MKLTNNYGLKKPEGTDVVDIEDFNGNADLLDAKIKGLEEGLDEAKKSVSDGKSEIAAAITQKKVPTAATDTFKQMALNIIKIISGSGNAAAADVKAPKTFTNSSGVEQTGTMPDVGAVSQELAAGAGYTVPLGYHNGNGKITAKSLAAQTPGNGTAAQLLAGVQAWVNGVSVTGTMVNRGAVSQTLGINGTYTVPAGYHNGSGTVKQSITTKGAATYTPGTSAQVIGAGQYLSGAQTIAAIPGNYVNVNNNQTVFLNGAFGTVVNQGYRPGYHNIASSPTYPSFLHFDEYLGGNAPKIIGSDLVMSVTRQRYNNGLILNGSINMTPFSKLRVVAVAPLVPLSEGSFYFGVTDTDLSYYDDYTRKVTGLANYYWDIRTGHAGEVKTLDLDISSINKHGFISLHFSCGSSAGMSIEIQSITLVK